MDERRSGCILNAIAEDGSVSVSTTGCEIGQVKNETNSCCE